MKKKGNKGFKETWETLFIVTNVTALMPQMKASANENSFSSFSQCHNRGNDPALLM